MAWWANSGSSRAGLVPAAERFLPVIIVHEELAEEERALAPVQSLLVRVGTALAAVAAARLRDETDRHGNSFADGDIAWRIFQRALVITQRHSLTTM